MWAEFGDPFSMTRCKPNAMLLAAMVVGSAMVIPLGRMRQQPNELQCQPTVGSVIGTCWTKQDRAAWVTLGARTGVGPANWATASVRCRTPPSPVRICPPGLRSTALRSMARCGDDRTLAALTNGSAPRSRWIEAQNYLSEIRSAPEIRSANGIQYALRRALEGAVHDDGTRFADTHHAARFFVLIAPMLDGLVCGVVEEVDRKVHCDQGAGRYGRQFLGQAGSSRNVQDPLTVMCQRSSDICSV